MQTRYAGVVDLLFVLVYSFELALGIVACLLLACSKGDWWKVCCFPWFASQAKKSSQVSQDVEAPIFDYSGLARDWTHFFVMLLQWKNYCSFLPSYPLAISSPSFAMLYKCSFTAAFLPSNPRAQLPLPCVSGARAVPWHVRRVNLEVLRKSSFLLRSRSRSQR